MNTKKQSMIFNKTYKNVQEEKRKMLFITVVLSFLFFSNTLIAQQEGHPRVYATEQSGAKFLANIQHVEWKKKIVEKKIKNLEKYLGYCQKDTAWLVSRLQMNWKTKHSKVFLKGGNFHHSEGQAPVATVRFSGTRDWATDYEPPSLEEIEPYFDDARGLYLKNKKTQKMEWVHPSKSGFMIEGINQKIMSLVEDAAFLYWLTGDKKYAAFAAPVFLTYTEGMYYRDAPIDLENGTQQRISGLATFEVIHEKILVNLISSYDFLFNYCSEQKISLDNTVAVFQKWGDQIITNGIPDNNWNLFQARYLTYVALVLEDNKNYKNGKGREYFLEYTFNTSTERQLAIKESLLVYDQETGIWPESAAYSVHVIASLLDIFTLLDHYTNKNELSNFPIIEKAALASFQYLFPSGNIVGFGDGEHGTIPSEIFELLIANYRKYNAVEKEALISGLFHQLMGEKEGDRKAAGLFELFFYVDSFKQNKDALSGLKELTSPTFYAPNASLFNQRLGEGKDAIMVSTVGSYGNHAHANGISIEFFANNYVLAPDMGKGPSYWHTDHRDYYARFPAHNTVVVDGRSDSEAMRGHHPFKVENCFPAIGQENSFDKLTFSCVSFLEPKTVSDQQRLTAIIKSNAHKGYVLDVFRSKKQQGGKQRHDYFYHNLGQSLQLFDGNNNELGLTPTKDFGTNQGDLKAYDYLKDKKTIQTAQNIQAVFKLKTKGSPDIVTKVWVKGSPNQKLYSVIAPKSNALTKGTAPKEMLGQPMPTLIVKRDDAAWENPFALVFNPFTEGAENPIEKVDFSTAKENPATQIVEVLLKDKKTTDRIVLNPSVNDAVENKEIYQKGLLSITRKSKENKHIDFLFLSGIYEFEQNDWRIETSGEPVCISFEYKNDEYAIQNDKPVIMKVPFLNGKKNAELRLYEAGKLVETRQGILNRANPNQLEFRLSKAYQKASIFFKD